MDKTLLHEVKSRLGLPFDREEGWILDKILGIGASASVYRAHKDSHARPIAIKVLHTKHQRSLVISQRFVREQHILAALEHPHTLRTFGPPKETENGELYMQMELLEGSSLSQLMHKRGRVPMEASRVVELMLPVLEVLKMCHDKQIFHRDLKPANLFLTHDHVVKVLDFGLAKVQDDGLRLTKAGAALGTPSFMSPEQAGSDVRGVDGRSDLFALGAIMHYLLSGQYVHEGRTPKETYFIAATTPAPSLGTHVQDLPKEVVQVVDKALAWERSDRWQSAQEMRHALCTLQRALAPPPPSLPARPAPPLTGGAPGASVRVLNALGGGEVTDDDALWRAEVEGEGVGSGPVKAHSALADLYAKRRQVFSESIAGECALAPAPSPYLLGAPRPFLAQTSQREFQSLRHHLMRLAQAQTDTLQERASALALAPAAAAPPQPQPPDITQLVALVCHVAAALALPVVPPERLAALHRAAAGCGLDRVHVLISAGTVMCQGVHLPPQDVAALAHRQPEVAALLESLRVCGGEEVDLRLPLAPEDVRVLHDWLQSGMLLPATGSRRISDHLRLAPAAYSAQAREQTVLSQGLEVSIAHTLSLCAALFDQLRDPHTPPAHALGLCSRLVRTFARAGQTRPSVCLGALALEPGDRGTEVLWAMAILTLCASHLEASRAELVTWLMASLLVSLGLEAEEKHLGRWVGLAQQLANPPNDACLPVLTCEALWACQSAHRHTPSLLGQGSPPDMRALLISMVIGFARARASGDGAGGRSHTDVALETIQGQWCHTRVDRMLFALMTRALGLGPRGSIIQTAHHWQAVVVANADSPSSWARPLVRLVSTPQGHAVHPVAEHDLTHPSAVAFGEAVAIDYRVKDARLLQAQERVLTAAEDRTLEALPALPHTPSSVRSGGFRARARSWLDGESAVVQDQTIEQLNQEASPHASTGPTPMGRLKMADILHLVPLDLFTGGPEVPKAGGPLEDLTASWHDLLQEVEDEGLLSLSGSSEVTAPLSASTLSELTHLDQDATQGDPQKGKDPE